MNELAPAIRYLRDCYQADSREAALWNLLGKRVQSPHFWSGRDELLDGTLDRLPADHEWASEVGAQAQLRRRERRLILAAFVVVGRTEGPKKRRVCAPLLHFDAEIDLAEVAGRPIGFVRPELDEPRWNTPVLSTLLGADEDAATLHELVESLPKPPFGPGELLTVARRLAELLPAVDWSGLADWPVLAAESELAPAMRRAGLRCRPCLASALVVTPPASRGVLHELSEIAEGERVSPPLRAVLTGAAAAPSRAPLAAPAVPAVLSTTQQQVLQRASCEPLSLVDGPPGTGKSFTSAAVAIDHLARGESVLIVTRSPSALAAIQGHVTALLGDADFALVASSRDRLRGHRARIEALRRGRLPFASVEALSPARLSSRLRRTGARLARLSRRLERQAAREQELGERCADRLGEGWLGALGRRWLAARVRRHAPQDELLVQWDRLLDSHVELLRSRLQSDLRRRLQDFVGSHRGELDRLARAPFARTTERRERDLEAAAPASIGRALPLWLCDVAALPRVLPLEPELFDVVLVDEATHCDPASCLPALQRAKRAVVIGDPRQLRHLSFLSRARQRLLAQRQGLSDVEARRLDYRGKSLLDLSDQALAGSAAAGFLDEHFRSRPPLIAFSNREFYDGRLRIMTARPRPAEEACLELRRVAGSRPPGGVNPGEVRALVDELETQLADARAGGRAPSIGVLSPFRAQVDALSEEIVSRFSLEDLRRHRVLVATAHGFQGHERDSMLLSLGLDDRSAAGARRWLERPDVLNVSLTRARSLQLVFHSFDAGALPASSLIRRYFDLARSEAPGRPRRLADEDPFLSGVRGRAEREGFEIQAGFETAGTLLDLVLVREDRALGLDLIGEPGRFAAAWPLERLALLRRAGLSVHPLCRSAWLRAPETEWSRVLEAFAARAS